MPRFHVRIVDRYQRVLGENETVWRHTMPRCLRRLSSRRGRDTAQAAILLSRTSLASLAHLSISVGSPFECRRPCLGLHRLWRTFLYKTSDSAGSPA